MSSAGSPVTGRPYGLAAVCRKIIAATIEKT